MVSLAATKASGALFTVKSIVMGAAGAKQLRRKGAHRSHQEERGLPAHGGRSIDEACRLGWSERIHAGARA